MPGLILTSSIEAVNAFASSALTTPHSMFKPQPRYCRCCNTHWTEWFCHSFAQVFGALYFVTRLIMPTGSPSSNPSASTAVWYGGPGIYFLLSRTGFRPSAFCCTTWFPVPPAIYCLDFEQCHGNPRFFKKCCPSFYAVLQTRPHYCLLRIDEYLRTLTVNRWSNPTRIALLFGQQLC